MIDSTILKPKWKIRKIVEERVSTLCKFIFSSLVSLWSTLTRIQQDSKPYKYYNAFPTRYILNKIESFQMRYTMKFYLKGHQKSKVPKKTHFNFIK